MIENTSSHWTGAAWPNPAQIGVLPALFRFASGFLFPGLIAAMVINNQIGSDLRLLGPWLNALNAAAACVVVAYASDRRPLVLAYTALVAAFYIASKLLGFSAAYETTLNVLYLFAGTIAAQRNLSLILTEFVVISLVGAVAMFFQLVGFGEWTLALSTQGLVAPGHGPSKVPAPVLFVPWNEIVANQVQTRPAGITHSTQFSSLLTLVTMALWLAYGRSTVMTVLLCIAAIIGLAKVSILGTLLVAGVMLLFPLRRRVAIVALISVPIIIAIYRVFFPGVIDIFLFSAQTILVTLMVRVADVAHFSFGYDYKEVISAARSISSIMGMPSISDAARIIDPSNAEHLAITTVGERSTGILPILRYGRPLGGAFAILFLLMTQSARVRKAVQDRIHAAWTPHSIAMILALAWFCVAADFVNAQIFWALLGTATYQLLGATYSRERRSR